MSWDEKVPDLVFSAGGFENAAVLLVATRCEVPACCSVFSDLGLRGVLSTFCARVGLEPCFLAPGVITCLVGSLAGVAGALTSIPCAGVLRARFLHMSLIIESLAGVFCGMPDTVAVFSGFTGGFSRKMGFVGCFLSDDLFALGSSLF